MTKRSWQTAVVFCVLTGLALALRAPPVWAQSGADPWDTSWLPGDRSGQRALDRAIDALLQETGLEGQGTTIRKSAQRHNVNPAFALAMFRKEAGFAAPGTLAYANKNPANIIATGDCWGEPEGARCKGYYGEVSTDGRFGRYATMAGGVEAFFSLMEREYEGMSLHALVSRACPPVECDVPGYVAVMEEWTAEYQARLLDAIHERPDFQGVVLDDREAQFWRRGPDEYWHQATAGYGQHMWWTRNNHSSAENAARWELALEQPGTYEFYAYIPPLHATSRQSTYTLYCAGQARQAVIDQYAHRNEWVLLGRVRCAAEGHEYVELSDRTGEVAFQYQVAFDAVGYRLRGGATAGRATPTPTPAPGALDPAPPQGAEAVEKPVLLERLWHTAQRVFPFCCGTGVLLLISIVLAIVFWDRIPFVTLVR